MKKPTPHTLQLKQLGFDGYNLKDEKDTPYSFFEVRNYQAEQEGVFLALLNHEFEITIEVPQKRSVVTLNYFKILKLQNDKEIIEFDELLQKRLKDMKKEDFSNGVKESVALRRFEQNKIPESIHLLIEMLSERNYILKTSSMGKRNSRSSVEELYMDGTVFNREEIQQKGTNIINCFLDRMKNMKRKRVLVIEKNDIELMSLLFADKK